MGVLVWEIISVSPLLFVFHGTNIFEYWPALSGYMFTVWWRSSTRASYRTRQGCYACDFQPPHGLISTVTVLGFAIINFGFLFCLCLGLDGNPVFRFWVCAEEHAILKQLSGLSQIAVLAISMCWMSCGRWTASCLWLEYRLCIFAIALQKTRCQGRRSCAVQYMPLVSKGWGKDCELQMFLVNCLWTICRPRILH